MSSRLNYVGVPESTVRIEPIGDQELRQIDVEYGRIGDPEPRAFELLCTAQVKLAVAGNHIGDDELDKRATELVGEVGALLRNMSEARGLDEEETQEVVMGNLDALPECSEHAGTDNGDGGDATR